MFKEILLKSVAGATAAGSLLAMSLVATPAMVTAAPEIRNVDNHCANPYPQSVSTTTQLSVRRPGAQFGAANGATVKVTRDEAGGKAPVGKVRIRIVGKRTWTVALRNGEASVEFPRRLPARRTYTITADYLPPACGIFSPSSSVDRYYTVIRARTRLRVDAPNVRRSVRPRVNVRAVAPTGVTVPGRVRVTISRRAVQVGQKWVRLRDGRAQASFPRKRPGYYQAEVYYPRRANFAAANGQDDFRILRRR